MRIRGKNYPAEVKVILSIYSAGFLGGTFNHIRGLLQEGFLGTDAPLWINIFWDSLTLLDPLAALLVWVKPKYGVALAVLIMSSDVIINSYAYASGLFGVTVSGMVPMGLFLQSLFATYIFVTAPLVLNRLNRQQLL